MIGLWTPTDWDKEAALLKEWLSYYINAKDEPLPQLQPMRLNSLDPAAIMRMFAEQGIMIVNGSDEVAQVHPLPFEAWRLRFEDTQVFDWLRL